MFTSMIWSVGYSIAAFIVGFIVTPILVAKLGYEQYGLYILVQNIASYALVFDFGFAWAAVRYFAMDRNDPAAFEQRSRTLLTLFAFMAVICSLVALIFGPSLVQWAGLDIERRSTSPLFLLASLGLAAQLLGAVPDAWLRADERFRALNLLRTIALVVLGLGSAALVTLGGTLAALFFFNTTISWFTTFFLWFVASKSFLILRICTPGWHPNRIKEMINFSLWSFGGRLAQGVILQFDRYLAALFGGSAGVTFYSVPANLSSRVNFLGAPAASVFFSRASALASREDPPDVQRQYFTAARILNLCIACCAVPLLLLGDKFLEYWIGPYMAEQGAWVLRWLAIGYWLVSVGSLAAAGLDGNGRADLSAKVQLGSGLLALPLALFLGKLLGVSGVAAGVGAWLGMSGICCSVVYYAKILRRHPARHLVDVWLHVGLIGLGVSFLLWCFRHLAYDLKSVLLLFAVGASIIGVLGWYFALPNEVRELVLSHITHKKRNQVDI